MVFSGNTKTPSYIHHKDQCGTIIVWKCQQSQQYSLDYKSFSAFSKCYTVWLYLHVHVHSLQGGHFGCALRYVSQIGLLLIHE